MAAEFITACATVLGGLLVAGATYLFTKQREREADWRKEKLEHYKAFSSSLSGIIEGESTAEGQLAFSVACNNLNLVAPQKVLEALQLFQNEIKISNPDRIRENHDRLLSKLFLAMREDLNIRPPDEPNSFVIRIWASGIKGD